MAKLMISVLLLLCAVYASLALKCLVGPGQQKHPAAAAAVKSKFSMRTLRYLNNLTKMRNSTSFNSNNGGAHEVDDQEYALYCWSFKCNGDNVMMGFAFPADLATDTACQTLNQHCTKETGDKHPYCILCNTDDCNHE